MNNTPWLDAALEEMRTSGHPGLVIAVPDETPMLGSVSDALQSLLQDPPLAAVLVCVRASTALARFGKKGPLLLLDSQGQVLATKGRALHDVLNREAVDALLAKIPSAAPRPGLPYGVEWAEEQHHELFGTTYDPCPPCGMPRFNGPSSNLVRYLRLLDQRTP